MLAVVISFRCSVFFPPRYKLQPKEAAGRAADVTGEIELYIHWRYNTEVTNKERLRQERDSKSVLKAGAQMFGKTYKAITGKKDVTDLVDADDVSSNML